MTRAETLARRLQDRRSKRVVFLSHCILNENTRYLGGACGGGCVRYVLAQCLAADLGMVQMPCPEQHAWGGVTKRLLLSAYGSSGTPLYRLRRVLVPLALLYTELVYRRIAAQVASQIGDYLSSGFSVVALVGIDGSPSCGVAKTLDLRKGFNLISRLDPASLTAARMNAIVRQSQKPGSGLFIRALQRELKRRRLHVTFLAHDLIAELDGKQPNIALVV